MALSKILPASQEQYAGARNLIINGAFECWQRSVSVSSQTGSGYKTADRWRTNSSGGTYNQSRQTVPLGDSVVGDFKYFLRHQVTTGDNFTGIQQRIEDVQSVAEGTVTLSFYAKGTNPNAGSIAIGTNQNFGTGGSPSTNVEVQDAATFTVTSSWQRFNFQLTVASISGKTLGTNGDSYFQIQFTQAGGDASTDAWTLDITGVQLELGDTATPFEHRSFADELARCQRYYEKSYNYGTAVGTSTYLGAITMGGGTTGSTTSFSPLLCPQYKVRKRTAPTVTVYDPAGTSGKVQRWQLGITNSNGHTGTLVDISETNFKVYSNSGANSSGITCHYEATAEL